MPSNSIPFDLTHEEREEVQNLLAELELHPERLKAVLAEIVLLRQVRAYASEHKDRFPPLVRAKLYALAHRAELRRLVADDRAELEG
jgi:hypothetical protein